jgi:predicted permease
MGITSRDWHRCAVAYRALVIAQTLGLAVSSLMKVVTREPRLSQDAPPVAIALAVTAAVGIAAGVLMYFLRPTKSDDRDAVLATWACVQVAGALALAGYAVTGAAICCIVDVLALVVMHVFSPNRFAP